MYRYVLSMKAILSTLALLVLIIYNKIKSYCDENNISYDVTVRATSPFNRTNCQTTHMDEHKKA